MKTARFPLYAKILCWFFLNLGIIGIVVIVLFRAQFRIGPEFLLSGRNGERLQSVARIISEEVNARPRPEWDGILQRFSDAYRVRFLLFRNEGPQLAGARMALPASVLQRMTPPGPRAGRRPRDGDREPPRDHPPERPPRFDEPRREFGEPPRPIDRGILPGRPPFLVRTDEPRRYWIGVRVPIIERAGLPAEPGTLLIVSESLRAGGLLADFTTWIWIGTGAVVFSALFWLPFVRHLTRSISKMQSVTAKMAEGKFDARVEGKRGDELGLLGNDINQMGLRLEGFVSGQKRFLGDIAHELCSPIARMQMAVGILEERTDGKDKGYIEDVREEVQHMSNLVNELLSFSKAALGAANIRVEPVSLRPLIERAVKREQQAGANITVDVSGDALVQGDPELIVRAISNLLRNAVRYAAAAGPISVSAAATGDRMVEIRVSDSGPGVPESELPKLFDPFYRLDTARARDTGGVGLGLAIVKTCVEACRGSVTCANREPHGFEIIVRLPAATATVANATVDP